MDAIAIVIGILVTIFVVLVLVKASGSEVQHYEGSKCKFGKANPCIQACQDEYPDGTEDCIADCCPLVYSECECCIKCCLGDESCMAQCRLLKGKKRCGK